MALPTDDALLAAALLAINPAGLKGANLRALSGPDREHFGATLRSLLPAKAPWVKVPVTIGFDRLLGGLDFAATVAAGKPVFATGLLEAAHGGVLVLAMAERLDESAAAIVMQALDRGQVRVERDGAALTRDARFVVLAYDEGLEPDEAPSAGLTDRLAFHLTAEQLAASRDSLQRVGVRRIAAARKLLPDVTITTDILEQLVCAGLTFGIDSVRAELLAVEAARAAAALQGKSTVDEEHAAMGARLVFSSRATRMPVEDAPEPAPPETSEDEDENESTKNRGDAMPDDVLVDAVRAAIPDGLLELLGAERAPRRAASGGRSNNRTKSKRRGRPVGVRPSADLATSRLNLLATLKAAAPWQTLRRDGVAPDGTPTRLALRKEDLHVTRFEDNVETTTIFVVDASGSQAAQRLAEVKGAIELLLNDCYVRRDQVALVAFRGESAETLLPPTRALARVKRSLSELPGGGATPLATGLDRARELATAVSRQGRVPAIVLLTDGRANVARDGTQGGEVGNSDAINAARLLRAEGLKTLLVDTARRPRPRARDLAKEMGAEYVPLPFADAASISATVQRSVA